MTRSLADFRIENDNVVLLLFAGGGKYRVSPHELPRYLSKGDLHRVNQALRMRKSFIKHVLPPNVTGVVVLAVVAVAGAGWIQLSQVRPERVNGIRSSAPEPINVQSVQEADLQQTSATAPVTPAAAPMEASQVLQKSQPAPVAEPLAQPAIVPEKSQSNAAPAVKPQAARAAAASEKSQPSLSGALNRAIHSVAEKLK